MAADQYRYHRSQAGRGGSSRAFRPFIVLAGRGTPSDSPRIARRHGPKPCRIANELGSNPTEGKGAGFKCLTDALAVHTFDRASSGGNAHGFLFTAPTSVG